MLPLWMRVELEYAQQLEEAQRSAVNSSMAIWRSITNALNAQRTKIAILGFQL
jgi:hypothetical protein